mgnify:CR=1 FL=1
MTTLRLHNTLTRSMEEFRPLVADSTLLGLVNGGRLSRGDFYERAGTVTLTAAGPF